MTAKNMTDVVKVIIRERPSSGQGEVALRHCDSIQNVSTF